MDAFTRNYIECMLWSSNDDSDEQGGEPLDENYSELDLASATLALIERDCARFQEENAETLHASGMTYARAGFCFWLNRNGHGSGFWDEDTCAEECRDVLSDACKAFVSLDPYVGDDGRVYL